MKGNVLGRSARAAKFLDHAHRAIGVKTVHHDRRRALEVGTRSEKRRDRITRALVVGLGRAIVFGYQVMIEKDRIVSPGLQQLARARDVAGDIQIVALEALGKPLAAPLVVFEQENPDRVPIGVSVRQPKFVQ